MKIYLASPFFNAIERPQVELAAKILRERGFEVYVPMEHTIEGGEEMSNHLWGSKVFKEDVRAINGCDRVVVLDYGLYSDSGTAWECGFAYGMNKWVIAVSMQTDNPVSLMVANGCRAYLECINDLKYYDFKGCARFKAHLEQK